MIPPTQAIHSMLMPTFKIFTAVEDLDAYTEVKKVHELLEILCAGDAHIANLVVIFSLFGDEKSREYATREAATADVIIISASGLSELSEPVRHWIENLPQREQPGGAALVVVFGAGQQDSPERESLATYLRNIAARCGLEFFCNRGQGKHFHGLHQTQMEIGSA